MESRVITGGVTWLNGDIWRDGDTPAAGATLFQDRGFVLGDGIFETLVVRRGQPVLWREHIDRLLATTTVLHFPLPVDFSEYVRKAAEVVLEYADEPSLQLGTLRITVTRGSGTSSGLDAPNEPCPTLMLRLTPTNQKSRAYPDRETTWIVDQPRIDTNSLLSGHKTTSSMWRILAHETARHQGANLALIKTLEGDIGEADTASLFAVIDKIIVTPPLNRGILPSTTRAFVIAELEASTRGFEERLIFPDDLDDATEVFLTSSVAGIRALSAIDGRRLPEAAPVSKWLDTSYEAVDGSF
jgi:branched-chain amino acid aminotransferase|tara:strand:- start:1916 stop:2812 length:897 start_codon:yes stop_codon:yes gene_type:complete